MNNDPIFTSSVHYKDPKKALAWLEDAFGFETTMAIDNLEEEANLYSMVQKKHEKGN